jgi:hypothetical protein
MVGDNPVEVWRLVERLSPSDEKHEEITHRSP